MIEDSAKAKLNAREIARLERQRKLAETLRLKADAEERGEDAERQKNWEWTIEDNDNWEKKQARKKRRADYEFHGKCSRTSLSTISLMSCTDDAHAARRKYKKDLDLLETDLEAYNRQKALATGSALTTFDASGSSSAVQVMQLTIYYPPEGSDRFRRQWVQSNNNLLTRTCTETHPPFFMATTSPARKQLTVWLAKSTKSTSLPNSCSTS